MKKDNRTQAQKRGHANRIARRHRRAKKCRDGQRFGRRYIAIDPAIIEPSVGDSVLNLARMFAR